MIGKVVLAGLAAVGAFALLAVAGWLVLLHATRDKEARVVTCQLCGERLDGTGRDVDADVLRVADHMRLFHPELEMDRWPDGTPVIVDMTLEPGDFA